MGLTGPRPSSRVESVRCEGAGLQQGQEMGGRELDRQEAEAEWGHGAGKIWGVTL